MRNQDYIKICLLIQHKECEISLSKTLKKDFSSHFHVIKYEVNFIQMAKKQNKDEESDDDAEDTESSESESEGTEFDEDENLEEETEEKGSDEYEEW